MSGEILDIVTEPRDLAESDEVVEQVAPDVHPMPEDAQWSEPESYDPVVFSNEPYIYERTVCGAFYYGGESMLEAWKHYTAPVGKNPGEIILNDKHKAFLRFVMGLLKRGLPTTFPVVMAESSDSQREEMGGPVYMHGHSSFVWSVQDAIVALQQLVDRWRSRSLNQIAESVAKGVEMGEDPNALINRLTEQAGKLVRSDCGGNSISKEAVLEVMDRIVDPTMESGRTIPSRFRILSSMVGDLVRGQIRAIGAPPGNGKTAFVIDEIGMALEHGFRVAAFLQESDVHQFVLRYICQRAGLDARKANPSHPMAGKWSLDELKLINQYGKRIWQYIGNLFLAKPVGYNAVGVKAAIQEWMNETSGQAPDLVVYDHLDCLSAPDGHKGSSYDAQKENLLMLRAMVGELDAAMIIASQLTVEAVRSSMDKKAKIPTLGAFRGGNLGEFAKSVIVLWKDEEEMMSPNAVVEQQFCVVKTNDGQRGMVRSLFVKPCTLHLEDHTPEQRQTHRALLERFKFNPDLQRKDAKG